MDPPECGTRSVWMIMRRSRLVALLGTHEREIRPSSFAATTTILTSLIRADFWLGIVPSVSSTGDRLYSRAVDCGPGEGARETWCWVIRGRSWGGSAGRIRRSYHDGGTEARRHGWNCGADNLESAGGNPAGHQVETRLELSSRTHGISPTPRARKERKSG